MLRRLLTSPFEYSPAFDTALKEVIKAVRSASEVSEDVVRRSHIPINTQMRSDNVQNYYCAYVGAFGELACNPRTLGSIHLNRMVSLEGIVTKCSLVRPKIIQSVHYSEKKDRFFARRYRDQTMTATGATSLNVYPQEDDEKNPVC